MMKLVNTIVDDWQGFEARGRTSELRFSYNPAGASN